MAHVRTLVAIVVLAAARCWGQDDAATAPEGVTLTRHRRYLLYPDGDPARIQTIIGVGIPLDLEDESVTIGYVLKMLFHIPQNSTDYTSHWYEAAVNARSHRTHRASGQEGPHNKEIDRKNATIERQNDLRFWNGTGYSEGGQTDLADLDNKVRNDMIEEHRDSAARWDIYKILEHTLTRNGMTGRACVLRTICEAAETPFTYHNGLLGELAHILFTPSTSSDRMSEHSDNEYHAAEKLGSDPGTDCADLFPECEGSFLEMFSEVATHGI